MSKRQSNLHEKPEQYQARTEWRRHHPVRVIFQDGSETLVPSDDWSLRGMSIDLRTSQGQSYTEAVQRIIDTALAERERSGK